MYIGDNGMIIYIENMIYKALDINDIIKKNGDFNVMSSNLLINNQIWPPIEIWKWNIHWIFSYSEVTPPPAAGSKSWLCPWGERIIVFEQISHSSNIKALK